MRFHTALQPDLVLSDALGDPMPKNAKGVEFSDRDVERIFASLPKSSETKGIEALTSILRYWTYADLPDHLSRVSLQSNWRQSTKDLEKVEKLAQNLEQAIKVLDGFSRTRLEMVIASGDPQSISIVKRDKHLEAQHRIDDGLTFLNIISRLSATSKRGRPRNIAAYLIVLDVLPFMNGLQAKRRPAMSIERQAKRPDISGDFFRRCGR
jgi:hypothetical protein